jgi:hypothetical protein
LVVAAQDLTAKDSWFSKSLDLIVASSAREWDYNNDLSPN